MTGAKIIESQALARRLEHICPERRVEWRSAGDYAGMRDMAASIAKDLIQKFRFARFVL